MNTNRETGPSIETREVHTRTTDVILSREEALSALSEAAMRKAGITDPNASAVAYAYQQTDAWGDDVIHFSATITEDLSPIIQPPDEAPTDPRAFRLGMPTLRGPAAEQYARSITP